MARQWRGGMSRGAGLCLVVVAGFWWGAEARAQFWRRPAAPSSAAEGKEEGADNVFATADRSTAKMLAEARKLLAEERYAEAVRKLGTILDAPEDFFVRPEKKSPVRRSLQLQAQQLVGQMPRDGRDIYELQFGARARRMLEEALDSGDTARLAAVSRRFFHTRSGYQATFLLGMTQFDHGDPLHAALTLQRLQEPGVTAEGLEPALSLTIAASWLQAEMPDKARQTLVALKHRDPAMRVTVAGREVPLFANETEAVDWLIGLIGRQSARRLTQIDRWLMFRGDAARTAAAQGSAPLLDLRWRVLATFNPKAKAALDQSERAYSELGTPMLPSLHPLLVGDVLVMRTLENLLAVDFASGKLLWEMPIDEASESVAPAETTDPFGNPITPQTATAMAATQRMWSDLTYGTLSSDGRYVYSIEDSDADPDAAAANPFQRRFGVPARRRMVFNPGLGNEPDQKSMNNRLAAHDIRSGKLKWHVGGPSGAHALKLADTFFLGPPLPLMGQLYVLGETKGEVRLMVLDAASGEPLWAQQLTMAEPNLATELQRRYMGVSPSYADGIVVCPTSNGAIVAVDSATRSLLWGYPYTQTGNDNRRAMIWAGRWMANDPGFSLGTRWADSSVMISEGRVLATPAESDSLYCLSLIDGDLLWKVPRQEDLYVACVDHEKVVLVGRSAVHALRIADKKPAWGGKTIQFPEGVTPSGRGFLSGQHYFLPLSSAEVVDIDLAAGKILRTSRSRKGIVPGNLVAYKNNIISQGIDGVDAYYQSDAVHSDVKQRLAANPKDAEALSLRGELELDAGKRAEAIESFRRAYQLEADQRTRELLRESLLDGLRAEFAAYRGSAGEVERLSDDSAQRAAYLRVMAGGLRHAGEPLAALDAFQKLVDLQPVEEPLDQIDRNFSVRRDRWIQAHLGELRREAKGDVAAKIDAAVAERLKAALAAGSVERLQRFFDNFHGQPVAAAAHRQLIDRLSAAGRRLEAELAATSEPTAELPAAAPQAEKKPDEKKGGKGADWPLGKVEASTRSRSPSVNDYYPYAVEIQGARPPYFRELMLQYRANSQTLAGYDGLGRELWSVSLGPNNQQHEYYGNNLALAHARFKGHLLMVWLGSRIIAIDTTGAAEEAGNVEAVARAERPSPTAGASPVAGSPRVLWSTDASPAADALNLRNMGMLAWQMQQQFGGSQDPTSLIGPLTNRYVCYQRTRTVTTVDPFSGTDAKHQGSPAEPKTLWSRDNIPRGSEFFGDEEYLFVVPPDRQEATVLRATDGELLGKRKLPRTPIMQLMPNGQRKTTFNRFHDSCLATFGRKVLLWWPEGTKRVLTLVDPWESRDLWKGHRFSANAHASIVDDEVVGVMEPSGRFVMISIRDGKKIADLKLEAEPTLTDITLLASPGQYFLLTNSPSAQNRNQFVQAMGIHGVAQRSIGRGRLYALDRQGKLLWPAPVVIKDQMLPLNQPARLPVITFACQMWKQKKNGQGQMTFTVLCIDKRNGRAVYDKEFANHQPNVFTVTGDAEKKTVDLIMQPNTIRLTFTDKALPPPGADPKSSKSAKGDKKGRAFWDSVQKALGLDNDEADE